HQLNPDIVILNFSYNDAEVTPRPSGNWLTRSSYAVTYVAGRLDAMLRTIRARPQWRDYYLGLFRDDQPGGQQMRASLTELKRACDDAQIRLLVVNYPELHQTNDYPLQPITNRIRTLASRLGIPFLDLLPAVVDDHPRRFWVNASDAHPNGTA